MACEVLGAHARPEPAVARIDPRACALDHDRIHDARDAQGHGPLDRGTGSDRNVRFMGGGESRQLDVEHVQSRRKRREAQLPVLVRGRRPGAANQSR